MRPKASAAFIIALAAAFSLGTAARDAAAQSAPSFEECENAVDEDALRREATEGARAAIETAVVEVDYDRLVAEAWRASFFDRRYERIVDEKIAEVRADRSFFERLADSNIPSFAEEVAERTTRAIFESAEFQDLQDLLMRQIAERLEDAFAVADRRATDVAAQCVQVYLGARYSDVVRTALAEELAETAGGVDIDVGPASAPTNLANILGAVLIVAFRRVIRRVIEAMIRRLVGVVAARVASWGSIVIGVAVLSYDVIAGSDGVFPAIREELLSVETRAEIQSTIVDELRTVGPEALDGRAEAIGDVMVGRWRAFRENHRRTLALAEREPTFASYLSQLRPEEFEKFSALVALIAAEGGDAAVMRALENGVLPRAMRIPLIESQAQELASEGVRVQDLIGWADLAGADYRTALEFGLPSLLPADAIDRAGLRSLLELDTPEQAQTIASLESGTRDEVLRLPPSDLRVLAREFRAGELEAVIGALRAVENAALRRRLLGQVVGDPDAARALADADAAALVADSASPERAIGVLIDPASRWDPFALVDHVESVLDGDVAPRTLMHRYGWAGAVIFGAPLIVLLGLLRSVARLFAPRRRS